MDAFQASAKRSGGKCNWNCIYPCVCITLCTPPTRRDLAAEWEKRECRTGDAPVSLKPDVWKRFSFTCTMRWKREKALTDKNNNWFIPTPGLFFRANCYCKILAFMKKYHEKIVPWMYYWGIIKLLDLDIVASLIKTAKHCLLAEQSSWLTTQGRLKRKYWTFTTLSNKRSSYIVDWDCSPHLFPYKQHIWLTHQVGRIKSWHTDAGEQVATLNPRRPRWWRECTRIAEIVLSNAKDECGFQWRTAGRVDDVTGMPTWLEGVWK